MSRYFIDKTSVNDKTAIIKGDDVKHISKVLRKKIGDDLELCDGNGFLYKARIADITSDTIIADIIEIVSNKTEPDLKVTLFQGLPKSDKMEYIIQKCVELGVSEIVPIETRYAVSKINSAKDALLKSNRWQKISSEAAKQCNRGILPKVLSPVSFKEAVDNASNYDLKLFCYEKEENIKLKEILSGYYSNICVFIGPEGGFSEEEVKYAAEKGFKSISLGPRILRTETAGPAVISILMYELGDIG